MVCLPKKEQLQVLEQRSRATDLTVREERKKRAGWFVKEGTESSPRRKKQKGHFVALIDEEGIPLGPTT